MHESDLEDVLDVTLYVRSGRNRDGAPAVEVRTSMLHTSGRSHTDTVELTPADALGFAWRLVRAAARATFRR